MKAFWSVMVPGLFAVAVVGAFRWMNPHPSYASNSIYSLLAIALGAIFAGFARLDRELRAVRVRLEKLEADQALAQPGRSSHQ